MTICIAAISDYLGIDKEPNGHNSKIIFCSDRLAINRTTLTDEMIAYPASHFDYGFNRSKIYDIAPYCKVLMSDDDAARGYWIIEETLKLVKKNVDLKIFDIASIILQKYKESIMYENQQQKRLTIEELNEIFSIFNEALDKKDVSFFVSNITKNQNKKSRYRKWFSERIERYNQAHMGTSQFIVFGFDCGSNDVVPKIYLVDSSPKINYMNSVGACVIGSGSEWSGRELVAKDYKPNGPLIDVIVDMFLAKKMAEFDKTVGGPTEIGIIYPSLSKDGISIKTEYLSPEIMKQLDNEHNNRSKEIYNIDKKIKTALIEKIKTNHTFDELLK